MKYFRNRYLYSNDHYVLGINLFWNPTSFVLILSLIFSESVVTIYCLFDILHALSHLILETTLQAKYNCPNVLDLGNEVQRK